MPQEPLLGGWPIRREVNELRTFTGTIEDTDRTDRRSLDDRKTQGARIDIEGTKDFQDHGAVAAIIAFMDGEARRCGVGAAGLRSLLTDQAPGLLRVFQAPSFSCGVRGRGVPSDHETTEPMGTSLNTREADMRVLLELGKRERKTPPVITGGGIAFRSGQCVTYSAAMP